MLSARQPRHPQTGRITWKMLGIGLAVVLLAALTLVAAVAQPAKAQTGESEAPTMIVEANSGNEPDSPSDRGGWQQGVLLGVVVLAVGLIAWRVTRQARRKQLRQAATMPASAGSHSRTE